LLYSLTEKADKPVLWSVSEISGLVTRMRTTEKSIVKHESDRGGLEGGRKSGADDILTKQ